MAAQGTEVARLVAVLEARLTKYEKDLARAQGKTDTSFRKIERRGKQMESRLQQTFRGMAQSSQLIHGPLSGISSRLTTIGSVAGSVNPLMAAFALSLGGATFGAVEAVKAFAAFEVQQATIAAVLRATGGAAGKTASDIEGLAQSIALNTLASTQDIRDAATVLLTFKSITGATFDEALKLSQDLAQAGFGTAKTAALQLGKAFEDPVTGLAALRRVGVSFTESQKAMIKVMYETGRTAEAQAIMINALKEQIGGAGAAAAKDTLAGAYDTLKQSTENLLVTWGRQISEALNLKGALDSVSKSLQDINAASGGGALEEQLKSINDRIEEARRIAKNIADTRSAIGRSPSPGGDARAEAAINNLLAKRAEIEAKIAAQKAEQADAARKADAAQLTAARERAQGVITALERERAVAGKTATEKRIIVELGKAGVTAETEFGQQIARNVRAIAAAEEALKKRNKAAGQASAFDRANTRLIERLAVLNAETAVLQKRNPLINDYGYATAEAAARQKLLNAALRDGTTITPALQSKIDALATSYALAASSAGQVAEAQQRAKANFEALQSTAASALSDVVKSFRDGTSASEAFANSLTRISDQLIEMATKSLVQNAFAGLLGGSVPAPARTGGLLGGAIIPGILHGGGVAGVDGGGHGRAVASSTFAGAPRYHTGGVAGLRPGEVPAILERGEIVLPKSTSRTGGPGAAVNLTVATTFNVQNGTPDGIARLRGEIARDMPQIIRTEVTQMLDRNPRLARLGA